MNTWNEVDAELPPVNEIVEVWLTFGQGGAGLRGYRITGRTGGESLWLNALTHEPFPAGWRVVRWKHAEGETVEHSAAASAERARIRA